MEVNQTLEDFTPLFFLQNEPISFVAYYYNLPCFKLLLSSSLCRIHPKRL